MFLRIRRKKKPEIRRASVNITHPNTLLTKKLLRGPPTPELAVSRMSHPPAAVRLLLLPASCEMKTCGLLSVPASSSANGSSRAARSDGNITVAQHRRDSSETV